MQKDNAVYPMVDDGEQTCMGSITQNVKGMKRKHVQSQNEKKASKIKCISNPLKLLTNYVDFVAWRFQMQAAGDYAFW